MEPYLEHARADKNDFLYAIMVYHDWLEHNVWVLIDTKIALEWGL